MDRVGRPIAELPPSSTTALGDWYANVLFWRPQVALFVNATTFVPVRIPLAPAAGMVARFPMAMAEVLGALGVDQCFVETEMIEMSSFVVAKTASCQVLGAMNEFTFIAEHTICTGRSDPADLIGLSVVLAWCKYRAGHRVVHLSDGQVMDSRPLVHWNRRTRDYQSRLHGVG